MAEQTSSPLSDALAIVRSHIVRIAMAATLVLGWLMTGERPWALARSAGLDWFLIDLLNRVTDLDEDLANGVQGTERVARRKRAVTVASFALLVTGAIGVLGGLMLAAPIGQRVLHPSRADRGLTSADCIWPTHVGRSS